MPDMTLKSLYPPMPQKLYVQQTDGHFIEMQITHTMVDQDLGYGGPMSLKYTFEAQMVATIPPQEMQKRVLAGDPINAGGIPPDVILSCPRCKYLNAEHMHTCSA